MQLAFDFCNDAAWRPERSERLFFGVLPDSETSARIARLRDRIIREHGLDGTRTRTERLHLSLHHIGDYRRLRSSFLYAATEAARAVSVPPFEMAFGVIKSFEDFPSRKGHPQRRPLVLLGEGQAGAMLHRALGAAMAQQGLRPGDRFTPHVTLLYGTTPLPRQAVRPIRLAVREFALIHSRLGLTQYEVIDRWPLGWLPTADDDP